MEKYGIYVHLPFCKHRCAYCDFNTYAGIEEYIPAYIDALCTEIEFIHNCVGRLNVQTIYFGGGTPSLIGLKEFDQLFSTLRVGFSLADEIEITIEANPGTLSLGYLAEIRQLGVNRLSLGMQSANPFELKLLERQHDFIDVIDAVQWGRIAGFENINLDLIYGLPHQSEGDWQTSLSSALGLKPEHISMYALGLEQGTPMYRWVERGLLAAPDPDMGAGMYEWGCDQLEAMGYYPYELSSWAKESSQEVRNECRHNLRYWRNQPYLGIGAGAHGFAEGLRVANLSSPYDYIHRLSMSKTTIMAEDKVSFPRTPTTSFVEEIDIYTEMQETMMLGLRLVGEGVSARNFELRFKRSIDDVFGDKVDLLLGKGLIEWTGVNSEILRLSKRGRLLGNQVFVEFV